MRVIVTGDRHWDAYDLACEIVGRLKAKFGPDLTIVHGGARGVDTAFDAAAWSLDVKREPHPARWDELGRKAGPIRNQEMVDAGADMALAFHPDIEESQGTADCVRRCLAAGIPVWLIEDESGRPVRYPRVKEGQDARAGTENR